MGYMTPSPVSPFDRVLDVTPAGATAFILGVALVVVAATVMAWAVIRAAQLPPPTALITSLSLLTLFATAGGVATNNEAAWTIAAAGVGALAGSVTAMFQDTRYQGKHERLASTLPLSPAPEPEPEPELVPDPEPEYHESEAHAYEQPEVDPDDPGYPPNR